MTLTVRRLADTDAEAARQLGFEAFGVPTRPPTEPAEAHGPGRVSYGAFAPDDGSSAAGGERLVAKASDRAYDSWFGGVAVPTCGVAGVTVALEHRGRGSLRPLFTRLLTEAKARGAVISTLFPTAPGVYRGLGYELIADYVTVAVPTAVLGTVGRPDGVPTRRATVADYQPIRAAYERWAREQNGPLTRRGVSFPATAEDFLGGFTGVTVAVDEAGQICGYASWDRGQGYGEEAVLGVTDLIATRADGHRALLAALGSFATVTGTTTIDTSGDDVARLFLATLPWRVTQSSPYMLKVVDVAGALTARRYPAGVYAQLPFRLDGDVLTENNGSYAFQVADGASVCTRVDGVGIGMPRSNQPGGRSFTPQGLALLYAGTQSCANLRFAGHLSGGERDHDDLWDALFGGRQQHIRNYF